MSECARDWAHTLAKMSLLRLDLSKNLTASPPNSFPSQSASMQTFLNGAARKEMYQMLPCIGYWPFCRQYCKEVQDVTIHLEVPVSATRNQRLYSLSTSSFLVSCGSFKRKGLPAIFEENTAIFTLFHIVPVFDIRAVMHTGCTKGA